MNGDIEQILLRSKDVSHYAWKSIDISHAEIHSGNYFHARLLSTALAASSWMDLELVTPSTGTAIIHLFVNHNNSGGLSEIILCDISTSSTYSHGGTAVSSVNHNLISTKIANMSVFTASSQAAFITSTMTSTQATLIDLQQRGSTGTASGRGDVGSGRNADEFVLKGASTYVIRIWNRNATGNATLTAYWYEE